MSEATSHSMPIDSSVSTLTLLWTPSIQGSRGTNVHTVSIPAKGVLQTQLGNGAIENCEVYLPAIIREHLVSFMSDKLKDCGRLRMGSHIYHVATGAGTDWKFAVTEDQARQLIDTGADQSAEGTLITKYFCIETSSKGGYRSVGDSAVDSSATASAGNPNICLLRLTDCLPEDEYTFPVPPILRIERASRRSKRIPTIETSDGTITFKCPDIIISKFGVSRLFLNEWEESHVAIMEEAMGQAVANCGLSLTGNSNPDSSVTDELSRRLILTSLSLAKAYSWHGVRNEAFIEETLTDNGKLP